MRELTRALGPIALGLLKKRHAVRAEGVPPSRLNELLAARGVPGHGPAIAFEKAYGGLEFPESGAGRGWRKEGEPSWLVGAGACLSADVSYGKAGKKKLVPVLVSPNDVVYSLDGDGVAWGEDTIEDTKPSVAAANGRAVLTRVLLWQEVFDCPEEKKVVLPRAEGARLAKALELRLIADASGDDERWWSDGKVHVREETPRRGGATTTVAHGRPAALVAAGVQVARKARAVGPVTFDSVMSIGAPVGLGALPVPGKPAAAYASFLDAKKHRGESVIEARVGGAVALCAGRFRGTITVLEEGTRIQLMLEGHEAYARKRSRVEIFFREYGAFTMFNLWQFDVKYRASAAIQDAWYDEVVQPWIDGLAR